jgi:ribonucleotide reductase alpha subunit
MRRLWTPSRWISRVTFGKQNTAVPEPGAMETTIMDTRRRVARALSAVEPADPLRLEGRFCRILQDYRFLPGGRIQAGAGTAHDVTLFNCFVMGAGSTFSLMICN